MFCCTFPDIAMPPGAENGSILDATFTSSPKTSPSFSVISPSWIPILRFRFSMFLMVVCISIEHSTAALTVGNVSSRPSPISLSQSPLNLSTIGLKISRWVSSRASAVFSSLPDSSVKPTMSVKTTAANFLVVSVTLNLFFIK